MRNHLVRNILLPGETGFLAVYSEEVGFPGTFFTFFERSGKMERIPFVKLICVQRQPLPGTPGCEGMDVRKSFGKVVKEARLARFWSQDLLATRSRLHRTYITDIERGMRNLTFENIAKLAEGLGIPIAELFPDEAAESRDGGAVARPLSGGESSDILMVAENGLETGRTLAVFRHARLANRVRVVHTAAGALDYIFGRGGEKDRGKPVLPVAILLDLNLPRGSGIEMLRSIMGNPRTRDIKVVVLASSFSQEAAREALRLGAAGCIVKPVTFQNFNQVMSRLAFSWTLLKSDKVPAGLRPPEQRISRAQPSIARSRPARPGFILPPPSTPTAGTPPPP